MKPKKIIKKLTLNKTTVSNLDHLSMGHIQGGGSDFPCVNEIDPVDPIPVLPPTYCNNCDDSIATQCLHSCFYACDSSRLCIYPVEI